MRCHTVRSGRTKTNVSGSGTVSTSRKSAISEAKNSEDAVCPPGKAPTPNRRHLRAAQRALLGGLNRGRSGWQANAGSPARPGRAAGRRGCRQGVCRCARAKFLAEIFLKKNFLALIAVGF